MHLHSSRSVVSEVHSHGPLPLHCPGIVQYTSWRWLPYNPIQSHSIAKHNDGINVIALYAQNCRERDREVGDQHSEYACGCWMLDSQVGSAYIPVGSKDRIVIMTYRERVRTV